MSREIKFRGQRKDTKEMIYGAFAEGFDGHMIMPNCFFGTVIFSDEEENEYDVKKDGHAYGGCFSVIPETVGQYTGLKDKNGKEIYEGDILKQRDLIRKIIFEMSCGSCCSQVYGYSASGNGHTDFIRFDDELEVIGNIYENPELL